MNTLAKTALVGVYITTSAAGLVTLRHFLPRVELPLHWSNLPPADVRLGVLLGGGLYVLSFVLWLLILRAVPLAMAYPAAGGLTICGSTAASVLFLGERIQPSQGVGIALVILGVVLILRTGQV